MTRLRSADPTPSVMRMGDFFVHPKRHRLEGADGEIAVEPRLMDVLLCLARAEGEVLSRQELLDRVWGDVIVGEEALTRAISELRRILGDSSQEPRYIETIRKGGYRLLPEVEVLDEPEPAVREPGTAENRATTVEAAPPPRPDRTPRRRRVAWPWLAILAILALAVVAVVLSPLLAGRPTPRTDGQPLASTPVTSYPGREGTPALSPDGSTLAFAWTGPEDGNIDLYVKQIGEESPLRLTDDEGSEVLPAWSGDGHTIYYVHRHRVDGAEVHSVMSVPLIGGEPREIFRARLFVSGFTVMGDTAVVYSDAETYHGPGHLYRRNITTGAEERITEAPGEAWDHLPTMGPDGTTLAFLRREQDWRYSIYVMDTRNREPHRLIHDLDAIQGMCWDREGESLVFARRVNGNYTLWRVWLADGTVTWIPVHDDGMFFPTVARNADRLVYQHRQAEENIWDVILPGAHADSATTAPLIASSRLDYEPDFSPDGSRLAFVSSRSGDTEIWACNAEGDHPVQLTRFDGPNVETPCWSPDGARIALAAGVDGFSNIYVVDYAERQVRRVTTGAHHDLYPTWSADGRWLYCGSNRDGEWRIWRLPADGDGSGTAVPMTEGHSRIARESADGRWLYFTRMYETGMWRLPLGADGPAGPAEQVIAAHPHADTGVNWGRWDLYPGGLVLLDRTDTGQAAFRYDFATGELTRLVDLPEAAASDIAVSPDGGRLLYSRINNRIVDLELVEGFI